MQIAAIAESFFHIIAKNRESSQRRFYLHFTQGKCQNFRRFEMALKSRQTTWPASRKILLQLNLFLHLVVSTSAKKLSKTSILDSQNIIEEKKT